MASRLNPDAAGRIAISNAEQGLEPITVRICDAVKLTGISRSTLYELIRAGQIKTVKVGRSTLVNYRSLKKLAGL